MDSQNPTQTGLEADEKMTSSRQELKYLAPADQAKRFAAIVSQHLDRHRFRGNDANALPGAQHFITTIYFDTPTRQVAEECRAGDQSLKLRAKEYYDVHPDLTELATSLEKLVKFLPVLWLETKRRSGRKTAKCRFGVPKAQLPGFFAAGSVTDEIVRIQAATYGHEAADVVADLRELCAPYDEPLGPDCLINYRRRAWQDGEGELRITVDSQLRFYKPPSDIFDRTNALTRENLGPNYARLDMCVIEIKSRGRQPDWLSEALQALRPATLPGSDTPFSKFLAGSDAVHAVQNE